MEPTDSTKREATTNPGYAAFQIARALRTSETHADASTREHAQQRVARWRQVFEGLLSGNLSVGTRAPIADAPIWATPEVVTGGFVTGRLLAGGDLLPYEQALLLQVPRPTGCADREALNCHFLSETGLAELIELLRSGHYRITVPEEGALLTVAWLVAHGEGEGARQLVDVLQPHFSRLRFYPQPAERPLVFSTRVYLEGAGVALERLRRFKPNPRVLAQREAIEIWVPAYDELIALFQATVAGDLPRIEPDAEGNWVDAHTGKYKLAGGWPCQVIPPGNWPDRAWQLCHLIEQNAALHPLCGRAKRDGDSFAMLHQTLKRYVENPHSLTGREVGRVRLILARHFTKCGARGSEEFQALRQQQREQAGAPMFHEVAAVLLNRLAPFTAEEGLADTAGILQPVTMAEATRRVPADTAIPSALQRKVARCTADTAANLVRRGIITSGDTLAAVIPQFTSGLRAGAYEDPALRQLFASSYLAFRRRRSLLLLNLEKQVGIGELPWVAAMERFRRTDMPLREVASRALKELVVLTLRAFPQAILPNKLVREFSALAAGAKIDLPLVEELAADIFIEDFSPKFTSAAKRAAGLVDGTLYARYYGLDRAAVERLPETGLVTQVARALKAPNPLVKLCIARAGVETGKWNVARNGMIIEQAQIVTSHNLAVLFGAFDLRDELCEELREMAERCFRWICRRLQVKSKLWHAKLIMVKNTAYAWRQMVFYVSQLPADEARGFVEWARERLREEPEEFRARFGPALTGLEAALSGHPMEGIPDARRFLGWTQEHPWVLGPKVTREGNSGAN